MSRRRQTGERFNQWTLVRRVPLKGWLCRCDCGRERVLHTSSVTSGRSKSCGHFRPGNPTRKAVPTYRAMHSRLTRDLGPARAQQCVDCAGPATDWSYDGQDPAELTGIQQGWPKPVTYSLDPDHYQPRCRPCHKRHDLRAKKAA